MSAQTSTTEVGLRSAIDWLREERDRERAEWARRVDRLEMRLTEANIEIGRLRAELARETGR